MSFMNYGFFGHKSSTPARETQQSESERLRSRQLSSLVRAGAQAKDAQQTLFEVHVVDLTQGPVYLQISLPQDFPIRAPHIRSTVALMHPFLDSVGNVTKHQDLNQWTAHSDIGRIVSEITGEMRKLVTMRQSAGAHTQSTPLSPPQVNQQSTYSPAPSASVSACQTVRTVSPSHGNQEAYRVQMPSIPSVFPELEELTLTQLEELVNDRSAVKHFIDDLSVVRDMKQFREDLMRGNMDIAKKTLAYEDEMRVLQQEISEKRAHLRDAQATLAQKQARQQHIVSRFRPDALLDQVSASGREADTASDDFAHQFTQGDMEFAEFITQYLPLRQLYHQRTIKFNKLMQH